MTQLIQHQFVATDDGSPSLEFGYDSGVVEKMHHSKGAFSETVYVYGPALNGPRFLSIGLGLGYNEIMCAAFSAQQGLSESTFLLSYEKETFLYEQLLAFVSDAPDLRSDFSAAYVDIFSRMSQQFEVPQHLIKKTLRDWRERGQWEMRGKFRLTDELPPFNSIFFDAFSNKMSPEFWSEEFLKEFLQRFAAAECVLATYAAKGVLNRALKAQGFMIELREGFGGKKQSTLAHRVQTISKKD